MIFTILRKSITQYRMNTLKELFVTLQQTTQTPEKLEIMNQIILKTNQHSKLSQRQIQIIRNVTNQWLTRPARLEKIASVVYILMKTKIKSKLMEQFVANIENDQWYVNFQQSVKALEILAHLKSQNHQISDEVFEKVERNIGITIWQVNMQYYQRIVRSLSSAQRVQSKLFAKVQSHIIRNMEMDFDQQIMLSILRSYSSVKKGSSQLYTQISRFLIGTNFLTQHTKNILSKDGRNLGFLLQAYGYQLNRGLQLDSDFYGYLGQFLAKKNLNFSCLQEVQKVLLNLPYFHFQDELSIIKDILLQARLIDRVSFQQLISFRATLSALNILQKNSQLVLFLLDKVLFKIHQQTDQSLLLILQSQQNQNLKSAAVDQIQRRFNRLSGEMINRVLLLIRERGLIYKSEELKFLSSHREVPFGERKQQEID